MTDEHRAAVNGVVQVLEALQALPEETRSLKNRITSNLLWVVTEFKPGTKHKVHGVRWRTPAAHALALTQQTKTVRHEHVIERRWMIDFLHETPHAMARALWNYPACLVTVKEHIALGKTRGWGWARYTEANIKVIDAETGAVMDLSKAQAELRQEYESLGAKVDSLDER
jgi:hypothetical protein